MAWKSNFTNAYISEILRIYYDISPSRLETLPGYEDLNLKVQTEAVDTGTGQDNGRTLVLKIVKMKHSQEEPRYALQDQMVLYLRNKGLPVPVPRSTINGNLHILCSSSPSEKTLDCCIRVMDYIPGLSLLDAGVPEDLVYEAGRLVGRMDRLLQDFETESPVVFDTSVEMSRFPVLVSRVPLCCDDDTARLAYEVFEMFDVKIKPVLNTFKKGYIHGDVRCDNIIVMPAGIMADLQKYEISGLIDFGDACLSYYIFEIAIFMADLICQFLETNDPFRCARLALRGFREEYVLSPTECLCLRLCICLRLMNLYILCSDDAKKDPNNKAITSHIHESLSAFKFLWKMTDLDFFKKLNVEHMHNGYVAL